ncbi:TetR family transcriptional regulator [Kitasatospora sp. NPDC056138]|uniref:TetR family transcriptional regulator n=1 Tax=Kitasatospora sp. NPDC056138 TaxID=3345724 RepID=UPI0035DEA218
MNEPGGLRTIKKERTRQTIADVAIRLFLARGFEKVSVAEIAAAAEVSKPTLFRYFASKEELVLHQIADHRGEAGRVVRARAAGVSPLAALRRHYLDLLAERNPVTGLCAEPEALAFRRLVYGTPSLSSHLLDYVAADTEALAAALAETAEAAEAAEAAETAETAEVAETAETTAGRARGGVAEGADGGAPGLTARLVAAQYLAVHQTLAYANWARVAAGTPLPEAAARAVADAETAFSLLGSGAAAYGY